MSTSSISVLNACGSMSFIAMHMYGSIVRVDGTDRERFLPAQELQQCSENMSRMINAGLFDVGREIHPSSLVTVTAREPVINAIKATLLNIVSARWASLYDSMLDSLNQLAVLPDDEESRERLTSRLMAAGIAGQRAGMPGVYDMVQGLAANPRLAIGVVQRERDIAVSGAQRALDALASSVKPVWLDSVLIQSAFVCPTDDERLSVRMVGDISPVLSVPGFYYDAASPWAAGEPKPAERFAASAQIAQEGGLPNEGYFNISAGMPMYAPVNEEGSIVDEAVREVALLINETPQLAGLIYNDSLSRLDIDFDSRCEAPAMVDSLYDGLNDDDDDDDDSSDNQSNYYDRPGM